MTPERRKDLESALDPRDRWVLDELFAEIDRITAIANEFARVEGSGPLACKECGQSRGNGRHLSLEDCMRNRGGSVCFAPEDHHPFVPGDSL